jgi:hypothetical protein
MFNEPEGSGGYYSDNFVRVVREWEIRSHLGRVLTIIDSLGLSDKQEKAIKDLIKVSTWKDFWNGGTPLIYSKEAQALLDDAINKEYEMSHQIGSQTPSGLQPMSTTTGNSLVPDATPNKPIIN